MAFVYDDEIPEYETEGRVKVKLYPSSIMPDRTVSTGERSAWTPNQLRTLVNNFNQLEYEDLPYMVVEHSTNKSDRLGRVEKLKYNEDDNWLYAKGRLFKNKKEQFERNYLRQGNIQKGVSLSYVVGKNYKGFLEFSFVKKPDFQNAELVRYHSSSGLLATITCLGPADIPSELNAARARMMMAEQATDDAVASPIDYSDKYLVDGSAYIVSSREHFDGVREHLLSQGVENPQITISNVDYINAMPEHKRNLFLAGLMSREGKRVEDDTRTEDMQRRAAFEKQANEARSLALSIAENNPLFTDDTTKSQLGEVIMTNDVGKLVAQAAAQALNLRDAKIAERDQEIQALKEEVEKRKRNSAELFERSQIRQHAASTPMTDWKNFWSECAAKAKENGIPSSSSSMTTTSSLASSLASGATIKQHSASSSSMAMKRSRPDIDTDREKQIDLHQRSTWMGMSLIPHPDKDVKVVQHSADGCSRALIADKSKMATEMEHISGFFQDLTSGRRSHGPAKRDYTKSLGARIPVMQTILSHMVNGPIETNGQAGIRGFEDKIPDGFADGISHLLPYGEASRANKYSHLRISAEAMENAPVLPGRAY